MLITQVQYAQEEISEALNNMSTGLVMFSHDGLVRLHNSRLLVLFALRTEDVSVGMSLHQYVSNVGQRIGWDASRIQRVFDNHLLWMAKGTVTTVEQHFDDGRIFSIACCPMLDGGAVLTYDDVTENRLRARHERRLLRIMDDMPVAIFTADAKDFRINYANDTARRLIAVAAPLLPVKVDDLIGMSIDLFHKNTEHQRRVLADPAKLPYRARVKLGPEVLDLIVSAIYAEDGSYSGPMLSVMVVTKEAKAEEQLKHLAQYDPLTNLSNRNMLHEQLRALLSRRDTNVSLLLIDLDGFKNVNDMLGHPAGDELLRHVATRLKIVGSAPNTLIARLGGDEFAMLTEDMESDDVSALAKALIADLAAPFQLSNNRQAQIGASIGIARAPRHGNTAEILLSRADIALYAAKAAGKRTYRVFSQEMESRVQERIRLETRLRDTLRDHAGLFLFYQPIVNLKDSRVTAREALIRWHHPESGWIPPSEFIPVAEDCGLVEQIGAFVFNRACQDAINWADEVRVSVNVSAAQLGRGTLVPTVAAALATSGLPPHRLEVEVTESAILNTERDCVADLRELHALGVHVALDDFGTGFSSLAHLRTFPFNKIKIDGSFVRDAVTREDCAAVIGAVAEMGRRMGVTIVAEGVENDMHLQRILKEGCGAAQGYLLGRPTPNSWDVPAIAILEAERQSEQGSVLSSPPDACSVHNPRSIAMPYGQLISHKVNALE